MLWDAPAVHGMRFRLRLLPFTILGFSHPIQDWIFIRCVSFYGESLHVAVIIRIPTAVRLRQE